MAISKQDAEQVYQIMLKYVLPGDLDKLLTELHAIKGNQSFEDSVAMVRQLHSLHLDWRRGRTISGSEM